MTYTEVVPETFPDVPVEIPAIALPKAPRASLAWSRALILAWIALGLFTIDRIALLLMDLWLFESLGYESVFRRNFRMGAGLFVFGLVTVFAATYLPAVIHKLGKKTRRKFLSVGLLFGILGGYHLAAKFLDFLLFFNSKPWGEKDPVFDLDVSFYAFRLPVPLPLARSTSSL